MLYRKPWVSDREPGGIINIWRNAEPWSCPYVLCSGPIIGATAIDHLCIRASKRHAIDIQRRMFCLWAQDCSVRIRGDCNLAIPSIGRRDEPTPIFVPGIGGRGLCGAGAVVEYGVGKVAGSGRCFPIGFEEGE